MKAATRAAFLVLTLYATSALAKPVALSDNQLNQIVAGEDFTIVNEVSDLGGTPTTDPLLVNPWGLSQASAAGPLWVANNGTGTSTLYNFSTFAKIPLNVTIPGAGGAQGTPTGTTFTNLDKNTFRVTSPAGVTGHSFFLFDGQDGTISGWAPTVDRNNAIIAVDLSGSDASFFGLTLQNLGSASQIYAADFGNKRVDVFNANRSRWWVRSPILRCRTTMRRSTSRRWATRSMSPMRSGRKTRLKKCPVPVSATSSSSIPPATS